MRFRLPMAPYTRLAPYPCSQTADPSGASPVRCALSLRPGNDVRHGVPGESIVEACNNNISSLLLTKMIKWQLVVD